MALFDWNDTRFSVSIKSMDNQHKGLVDTLNELHDAMKAGKAREITGALLDKLVKYTKEHFAAEEGLMKQHQFPGYEAHSKLHRTLTGQVEDFVARFKKGDASLNLDLLGFLREWLVGHIQNEDRQYGKWLKARDIS